MKMREMTVITAVAAKLRMSQDSLLLRQVPDHDLHAIGHDMRIGVRSAGVIFAEDNCVVRFLQSDLLQGWNPHRQLSISTTK